MDIRSPRGIIPVSKNVVQMMQTRLEEVENSATQLTKEIVTARQDGSTDRFSILLSKTQSMESVLQSLKLNFVNLSTLTRQPSDLEQKLVEMTDVYTEEIKKLSSENAHLKTDKQELNEKRQHIEVELQKARLTLEEVAHLQSEKEEAVVAERKRAENLLRKVAELDKQLNEERQLRFALDRANSELGQRLDEMESMLKQEHLETQDFTNDFIKLKKDFTKKCEELKQEKQKLRDMEQEMVTVCQELDAKLSEVDNLKREQKQITGEISTVHDQYGQLSKQLDAMQELLTEYQKEKADAEVDCVKLTSKIDELNSENTRLGQELVRAQNNDESARLIDTRQQLRHMTKQRDQSQANNEALAARVSELETSCQAMDKELSELKENADQEAESKYNVIGGLQERLSSLKSELMSLEGEKENLLSEVNGAVDAMDGERNVLQSEIESYQQQLSAAIDDLEEEKARSQELEHKLQSLGAKPDFPQFDRRLTELTGQKNTLSYENGKLQSQVEQLQSNIESLKKDQASFDKVSKKLSQAENKTKKLKHELESCKQALAQSELTSQQLHTTSEMRETDYNSAIRSRDEALRDAKMLATRVESLEDGIQQQDELKSEIEERLREDNSKVAESLENMMALHTELQCKYESLQIDLGKKDTQINAFNKERKKSQDRLARLEVQLESSSEKLSELQGKQSSQTKNLEREIKSTKMDNSKLVRTLQDTLDLNEQLRAQVSILEETLYKQKSECDKLSNKSNELQAKLRQQESTSSARISELEAQVNKERDKAYERMEEQLKTVQKETENILERNSSLLQHNSTLKSEISELSDTNETLKRKLDCLKEQLSQSKDELKHRTKQSSKLKGLEEELDTLQETNQELSSRCLSQQKTINKFVAQFKELQEEMKELVGLHTEQTELLAEKERQLQADEMTISDLQTKYCDCKKQIAALQSLQKTTETRLMEANNDTLIATETLEDTNRYFKERFSALAGELSSARRQHLDLEWRNLEKHHQLTLEQKRVDDTASKARDMIKASRHQLTNIADKAEFECSMREETSRRYEANLSPIRSPANTRAAMDTSVEEILSVSQQKAPHSHNKRYSHRNKSLLQSAPLSPFSSSSQKLDAIINEMEQGD